MTMIIRIPLKVENLSALAGFYTDGPSFAAIYGLVSQLELDASFKAHKFGLVVESYESRTNEILTTGLDAINNAGQRATARPSTGFRYANMAAALYIQADELDDEDRLDLVKELARSINTRRLQGGNLIEFISDDPADPVHIKAENLQDTPHLAAFIAQHEHPLASIYLSAHLPDALEGDQLIEAYAEQLMKKDTLMVCNGYIHVGSINNQIGEPQHIGEPSYTLAKTLPVYELKKQSSAEQEQALKSFFWSFDVQLHKANITHFLIT